MKSRRLVWVQQHTKEELVEQVLLGQTVQKYDPFFKSIWSNVIDANIEHPLSDYVRDVIKDNPVTLDHVKALKEIITSKCLVHLKETTISLYIPIDKNLPMYKLAERIMTGRVFIKVEEQSGELF